ncbi:hypothetical protein AX17_006536 [Amanita inopinata Kibby_2008]|nr:hypothetical protein AX17_006536 [Amanita inopinata Kibby_2008]
MHTTRLPVRPSENTQQFAMTDSRFAHIDGNLFNVPVGKHVMSNSIAEQRPIDRLQHKSVQSAIINLEHPTLYPGTRQSVLDGLDDWMREEYVPLVLLSGPRGSGKTTISQTFAYMCSRVGHPVISFSFSRHYPLRSHFHQIFSTLCAQLYAHSLPPVSSTIDDVLRANPFILSRPPDQQFRDLIIYPIRQSFVRGPHSFPRTFVILLDGLDDCDDRRILKRFFAGIKGILADESHHSRIKVLCTSNDDPSVLAAFSSVLNYLRRISTNAYDANDDIRIYLNGRLDKWKNARTADWPWNDLINNILTKASGNFGAAVHMLEIMERTGMNSLISIRDVLKNTMDNCAASYSASRDTPQVMTSDTRPISPLDVLINVLREKTPEEPIYSFVNTGTVDFMSNILRMKDYVNIPSRLDDVRDAENLLEFLIYLLDNGLLVKTDLQDANRRARRFMIKLVTKTNATPKSLYLTDVVIENQSPVDDGGFSNVYAAHYRGIRVAVKRLRNTGLNIDFRREALTWRTLSHEYILPFLGIFEENESFIGIVSPFMENGTLWTWRGEMNPSVSEIGQRILEVAEGVQYLHCEGIIHGDLRGANILLDSDFAVRIADFGLTRHADATATKTYAMSYYFSAPELFDDDRDDVSFKRTVKTDVFSFACLYYEIHFNRVPLRNVNGLSIGSRVKKGKRATRLAQPPLDDDAWDLISRCWHQDAGRRPSMDDIVDTMVSWGLFLV